MLPGRKTLQILSQCALLCLLRGALPGIHAEAVCHRDTKEGAARPAGHGREASAAACHKALRSVAGWGGAGGLSLHRNLRGRLVVVAIRRGGAVDRANLVAAPLGPRLKNKLGTGRAFDELGARHF